ncbi:MAG: F0F1 ATP synthase subunit A [Acidobacteria bacterium]|nr:F0F1 ATP synthase subunit A [Acidobacteriota bacterium]
MEKLHHELWIVQLANAIFGPVVASALKPLGVHFGPGDRVVPDYLVMVGLIVLFLATLSLVVRSRLSVENPGKLQIVLEDIVGGLNGMLEANVGPKGRAYLPIVGTIGLFILTANLMGLVPGLMAPTSNINVTLGCALTVWFYYHVQGVKEQGILSYLKHFAAPPGAPLFMAPIMLPIEIISHLSRVLSLSMRLFGNIFGEELVILILFSIVPFLAPLPMMFLAIITGTLQAFIFIMLTMIYLQGAVAAEHPEHGAHAH